MRSYGGRARFTLKMSNRLNSWDAVKEAITDNMMEGQIEQRRQVLSASFKADIDSDGPDSVAEYLIGPFGQIFPRLGKCSLDC
ncbi:hypothetical protein TNIN_310321 [Trichonephila inaurata madagascariensis]|uniref:Uncharacterized protein n=1 Tax=Trichonephila inaurata madagascariensis TaxID=2747483 RepID=A0A8X6YQY0_9ARAC|nr:hypothetical protein TNIN_310321 [Trichonephila inaurata madagascariensis]